MELIDESKPIARKEHVCDLCSRKICKGQKYRRRLSETMAVKRGLSKGMKNAVN